jgi:uncharacterized protein YbaA (DUF1428 family)
MSYLDGFVLPVPADKKEEYRAVAAKAAAVFQEYGAIRVFEGWGSDVPRGEVTDFYMATKAEESDNVVFSWILWPSKEVRDTGWEKVMADDRMKPGANPMPFDGMRMFWGGFEQIVDIGEG